MLVGFQDIDNVLSVVELSSTNCYERDGLGRATTVATTIATLSQSVSLNQVFDAASNRTELRATVGSTPDFKNNYTYDKLRRLTDVVQTGQAGGNPVVSKHIAQSFNAASQRTNITRYQSAGTTNLVASTIFTYDTVGRLSGIGHTKGATNLNTYAYTYDPLSRLSSVTSTAEGTTNYSYFNDSQLKSASGSRPTESYTYDTNGNRTMAGYSTIADNRTTADASFTYTYDAEGNLTRKTNKSTRQVVATYEWDHRNRLTKVNGGVTGPGGIEYEYDAFNRLVRRRAFDPNVPNQYWVYDEGINPVLQFDTGGNAGVGGISHRYIWSDYVDDLLSDEQISFPSNSVNTLWPLADHLGSIRDIADFNEATGITAIANHRTYDSFGKLVDETGTASIPFGYTGKLFDKTTGLQNNLNRWYDPNLGKWISQDPIGFAAGDANLYRYVGNSPTNATDPSGLQEPLPPRIRQEVDPNRRPLDNNRAMGGIAIAAHGTGIPAGSLRTDLYRSPWESYNDQRRRYIGNRRAEIESELQSRVVEMLRRNSPQRAGTTTTIDLSESDRLNVAKSLSKIYVDAVDEFLRTRRGAAPEQGSRNAILDFLGVSNEFNHPWCDDWARFVNQYVGDRLNDRRFTVEIGDSEMSLGSIIRIDRYYWCSGGHEHNYNGIRPWGYQPTEPPTRDNGVLLLDPWLTLLPLSYWPSEHPLPPTGRGLNPQR